MILQCLFDGVGDAISVMKLLHHHDCQGNDLARSLVIKAEMMRDVLQLLAWSVPGYRVSMKPHFGSVRGRDKVKRPVLPLRSRGSMGLKRISDIIKLNIDASKKDLGVSVGAAQDALLFQFLPGVVSK